MKTLIVPSTILLLSLAGAWMQLTAEPDKIGDNEVLVMANQATNIESIDWVSSKQEVHVSQRTDEVGTYLWVEYIDKKAPDDPQQKYFIAGKNGDKMLDNLSPLIGIRKLDGSTSLEEIGLDEPTATLTITSNGSTRQFSIGDEAYGTKDLYLRDDKSNELFLVDDSKLRQIRQARTTLPNRALFSKDTKVAEAANIQWNGQSLKLTHQNWQDSKNASWVYTDSPEADATQIQTWLTKALRVSVSRSATPDEEFNVLEDRFSLQLTWGNETIMAMYAYNSADESWWASTPSTRGYVRVSGRTLDGLFEDLPTLFE